jgi:hypothetical protein
VETSKQINLSIFFSSLFSLCSKEMASDLMVYSYRHGFSGFAAKLTESQVQKLAGIQATAKSCFW